MEQAKTTIPFTVYAFTARKPGMTMEAFKDYYENHHVPYFLKLVDGPKYISKYDRSYVQKKEDENVPGVYSGFASDWEYDCIVRVVYRSESAFKEMLKNLEGVQDKISEDEKNFLNPEKMKVIFVGESPSYDFE